MKLMQPFLAYFSLSIKRNWYKNKTKVKCNACKTPGYKTKTMLCNDFTFNAFFLLKWFIYCMHIIAAEFSVFNICQ